MQYWIYTNLYDKGVDAIRLNTAHQSVDDTLKVVQHGREVSDKIAFIVDTKGPEIRTSKSDMAIHVEKGNEIKFSNRFDNRNTEEVINVSYANFVAEVPVGSKILIDDGDVEFEVVAKDSIFLYCVALNSGQVGSKKSVNVPGVHIYMSSLTDKDIEYINFCCDNEIDYIAHSFVRRKQDVLDIKDILARRGNSVTKVIAKIENQEGVDNIEDILEVADGVMVARGDLAIEVPAWEVPIIQKRIIEKSIRKAKFVITATQMLHTMIKNPRPTRAEINDVANAVFDGSDAVMLSGETAYGDYPVESVEIMSKIIRNVEFNRKNYTKTESTIWHDPVQRFIAKTAIDALQELPIKVIVCVTKNGFTARLLSSYRPGVSIFARCISKHTMRHLALEYGVIPSYIEDFSDYNSMLTESLCNMLERNLIQEDDLVLMVGTSQSCDLHNEFIEIKTAKEHFILNQ